MSPVQDLALNVVGITFLIAIFIGPIVKVIGGKEPHNKFFKVVWGVFVISGVVAIVPSLYGVLEAVFSIV